MATDREKRLIRGCARLAVAAGVLAQAHAAIEPCDGPIGDRIREIAAEANRLVREVNAVIDGEAADG